MPKTRRCEAPLPVRKLVRQIVSAANGTAKTPPRMQIATAYGVLTLEAKWLVQRTQFPKMSPKTQRIVSSL